MAEIRTAVEHAEDSHTFRVRGQLAGTGMSLTWEGVVVDGHEQYRMMAGGVPFESRRIDGALWGRRLDRDEPWRSYPNDGPIDLAVLLHGVPEDAGHGDGRFTITLRFDGDIDVLRALTHVPSTGPTTADITLADDVITNITLHVGDGATASLALWDYGAALAVDPVTTSPGLRSG